MKNYLLITLIGFFAVSCNQEKTAYVETEKLMQDYLETKDVEKSLQQKSDSVQTGLAQMSQEFQTQVQEYQSKASSMSAQKREETEQTLLGQQRQIQQIQQRESQIFQDEYKARMDSLVNKVKKYVGEYAKKNGYTYIFGSNNTENILYGAESKNVTEDVLKALNEAYKPE
ncbi:MAG: OmpH family outer membrane protein [Bacteroidetes bacterium]|nr:OmpH family outer membrane protein [Bacteroidota bacterium]